MKYIPHILITLYLFVFTKTEGQVPDSLMHEFCAYKWIDLPVTDMDYGQANSYLKKNMRLEKDRFILFNDTLNNIKYTFRICDKLDFFRVFTDFDYRTMGIVEDSILVLRVNSPINDFHPPHDIIISKSFLITEYGGFFYFFHRNIFDQRIKQTTSIDTVRCLYHEGKYCTRFVIQGSRKAGAVIHVKPLNKNVPMEIEERDGVPGLPRKE